MSLSVKSNRRLEAQLCDAVRRTLGGGLAQVPEAGRPIWRIFLALSEARTFHQAGPNPISFGEIEAWSRLMCVPLQPQHVNLIRAMDAAWVDGFFRRQGKARSGVKTLPPVSTQPLSAALFDITSG